MQIWGLSERQIWDVVRLVSEQGYDGNIMVESLKQRDTKGQVHMLKLRVASSRSVGAKRTPTGRRTVALDWGGFRDVIRALFHAGAVRVKTAVADYRGLEHFEDTYMSTKQGPAAGKYPVCASL